jgi:hypothetical protein
MTVVARLAAVRRLLDRRLVDGVAAAALFALMAAELAAKQPVGDETPTTPVAYLWALAIAAPIAWHRRHPVTAVVITGVAIVGYGAAHFTAFPGFTAFAMVFAVSLHSARGRGVLALAVMTVALGVALAWQSQPTVTASTWFSTVLALVVAWLAGRSGSRPTARTGPGRRSPRSGCASPASCTTWSRTR